MTQCRDTAANLNAYLDGELDAARADSIRQPLQLCAACRRRHEAALDLAARLREMPPAPLAAGLAARIGQLARQQAGQRAPARTAPGFSAARRWWRQVSPAVRLAAAALLLCACLAGSLSGLLLHDHLAALSAPRTESPTASPESLDSHLATYQNSFAVLPHGSPARDYLALLEGQE